MIIIHKNGITHTLPRQTVEERTRALDGHIRAAWGGV